MRKIIIAALFAFMAVTEADAFCQFSKYFDNDQKNIDCQVKELLEENEALKRKLSETEYKLRDLEDRLTRLERR